MAGITHIHSTPQTAQVFQVLRITTKRDLQIFDKKSRNVGIRNDNTTSFQRNFGDGLRNNVWPREAGIATPVDPNR